MHECCKTVNERSNNDKCHIPLYHSVSFLLCLPHIFFSPTAHSIHAYRVFPTFQQLRYPSPWRPSIPEDSIGRPKSINSRKCSHNPSKDTKSLCDGHRLYNHIHQFICSIIMQPIHGTTCITSSIYNLYPIFG